MNSETDIESLLRLAPAPRPPAGLKEELLRRVSPRTARAIARPPSIPARGSNWIRRWWPALAPAAASLACAAVFVLQQKEIRGLRQEVQTLSAAPARVTAPAVSSQDGSNVAAGEAAEIAQLTESVRTLSAEVSRLEGLRTQNQNLRAQLASAPADRLMMSETEAMEAARARADEVRCANNMKQLGLAARVWAGDNEDHYPPDIVCMSNEMNTPIILVCPSDAAHQPAANFGSFNPGANCSYEWFLNPPGTDADPTRVLTRCPIHGTIGLYDGSVQQGAAKKHPEWLVQRDGKLYYEPR